MKHALITTVFLLGLVSISAGCLLIDPALGLIAGGAMIAYVAMQEDRASQAGPRDR